LLTHSVGCQPLTALARAREGFFDSWGSAGSDAWPEWLARVEEFRAALARLLGGAASEYCPQVNVSSALVKLLPALPRTGRRNVVVAAEDTFPSLGYALQGLKRLELELRLIPRERDPGDLQTWADAITEDVCVALITHVHSNTAVVAPVESIAPLCASRGVYCIVDVAQSAGILPLRVEELQADALLGSCIKWLCGGPGAGFLWVRPGLLRQLEPIDRGWFSHADPFEMDIHRFSYADDARRFWGGTPSILPFIIATAGLDVMASIGISNVFAHNRALVRAFLERAPRWLDTAPDLQRLGGTLCLRPGTAFDAVCAALTESGAHFDTRGPVVRLSFHVCNSIEDARYVSRTLTA
jgi:kynureninase